MDFLDLGGIPPFFTFSSNAPTLVKIHTGKIGEMIARMILGVMFGALIMHLYKQMSVESG